MKKAILFLMVMALTSAAFGASVVGSKHDLRTIAGVATTNLTEVCVVCHTPHQTASANAQDPLWNRNLSGTIAYGVYGSATMNAVPVEVGGPATLGGANTSTTNLCLSCHDGTISVLTMLNPPGTPGVQPTTAGAAGRITAAGILDPANSANIGTNLTDDHPVNFTYDAALVTADGGLQPVASVSARLYGGKVQCTSCHNVHDPQFGSFLVASNTGSALCLQCHIK